MIYKINDNLIAKTLSLVSILFFLISCSESEVNFENYDILITAKEISKHYNISLDTTGNSESAFIRKWNDGAYDFSYSYEPTRDFKNITSLIYFIDIAKRNSIKEAKSEFNLIKKQFNNTWASDSNQSVKIVDSLNLSGEENYYAIRYFNNQPNGIFLASRNQNIIYSLILSGFYINDTSLINLVEPKIKNLAKFTLKD